MAYTTINKSTDYFNTKLYTGNTAGQSITGIGFKPDFTWFKGRVGGGYDHSLRDILRGTLKHISSNASSAESDAANSVSSFDTDGFTLGTDNRSYVNENGTNYVSWSWLAGGGQGSSNTDGSINTTYTSANTTSGFSIVSYTGNGSTATVGHGLGVVPQVIIIKCTSNTGNWQFYHQDLGNNKKLILNTTGAEASSGFMNNTSPTSSVFTVINDVDVGQSGYTYVAYCFAKKTGFSKFGSYTGNGNADGAFVYTGFKPAWIMIKRYDSGTLDWNMYDNKRLGYNGGDAPLFANLSNAESNDLGRIDFLSNGFKIRTSNDQLANNGGKYLYMAFAEAPLVGSNNVPATAK